MNHIDEDIKHEMIAFCILMIKEHNASGNRELVGKYADLLSKYYQSTRE